MLALWILAIIIILILAVYSFLLLKRLRLLRKIKKHADHVSFCRNVFRSVFLPDGKPDLIVEKNGRHYTVSVFTTPLFRTRYHFDNNQRIDLYRERKAVFIINSRVPNNIAYFGRSINIKKYKITFEVLPNTEQFVIPHPAPLDTSRATGSKFEYIGNGDFLFDTIRICGLKYFLDYILSSSI